MVRWLIHLTRDASFSALDEAHFGVRSESVRLVAFGAWPCLVSVVCYLGCGVGDWGSVVVDVIRRYSRGIGNCVGFEWDTTLRGSIDIHNFNAFRSDRSSGVRIGTIANLRLLGPSP